MCFRYKCLRCSDASFNYKKKPELMLHLAVVHYQECLIPVEFLRENYAKTKQGYPCSEMRCKLRFSTLSGLVAHEQLQHNALEVYLGEILGNNDLYEEHCY